jgi:glycosyltransferase involved in cell wall biosynthesis
MRVAAFTKYGRLAASTRQRLLQYIPALAEAGIEVDYRPLLDDDYVASLASGKPYSRTQVARSYLNRLGQVTSVSDCDLIWVYAEMFPYLPSGFEKLVLRAGKPVVYDFDDAFFHQYESHPNLVVRSMLKGKLEPLLRGAAACCCGNEYLLAYAERFCGASILLPTVVDATLYCPASTAPRTSEPLTIGWIGSPSTWPYVKPLMPLLQELAQEFGLVIRIVGAGIGAEANSFHGLELVDWSEDNEIDQVRSMDIGIMPLPEEDWAKGKSGYKLIQYMACGLPVVASPVGVNVRLLEGGDVGFLATGIPEWRDALIRLVKDPGLRERLGIAGRRRVEAHYSVQRHAPRLIKLFASVANGLNPSTSLASI